MPGRTPINTCAGRQRERRARAIALLAATALFAAPVIASAQSCYNLAAERDRIDADVLQLVQDHPGVHAMLVGCLAQATSDPNTTREDQGNSFAGCTLVGCLFLGFGNCIDVGKRWYELVQRKQRVEDYMRRQQC